MEFKKKETCPYCGKQFVQLDRHKCKFKPQIPEQAIEYKMNDTEQRSEDSKEKNIKRREGTEKEERFKESDIIAGSHSETIRFISKFFKPDTIKLAKERNKKVIKDLLKSPIESYNFLDNREVNFIKLVLIAFTIEELLQYVDKDINDILSPTHLKSLEEKGTDIPKLIRNVQKAITISSILNQLKEKSIKLDREGQKIMVAGLDQAGKTAILTTYGGQLGIENLSKLKPTIEVDRKIVETKDFKLFIWDFGGQTKYRERYLQNPGAYFINLSLLLYVIDIQDYGRYDESFKYFKEILKALRLLEETPYILVFIHKYDPDLRDDPDIQLNVEYVKENIREILAEAKEFDYEIYLTSIYSMITREPKFSKIIKEMVNTKALVVDPTILKVEELGKVIENALKTVMTLSESVAHQFNEIDARFSRIEELIKTLPLSSEIFSKIPKIEAGTQQEGLPAIPSFPLPPSTTPPPVESSTSSDRAASIENVRNTIISDLKQLFAQVKKHEY